MAKKNKDGVYEPIKREMSDAEKLPTAAQQRPKEDDFDILLKQREKNSRNREEESKKPIGNFGLSMCDHQRQSIGITSSVAGIY